MTGSSIVFANDDILTQWIMGEVLRDAGFDVASACRGREVVDLLDDASCFDALLLDLQLVDMAGSLDVVQHWRRALPGRPVIYTGSSRSMLPYTLQRNESFLQAPFTASALLRSVDLALEEAYFRPLVTAPARSLQHVH